VQATLDVAEAVDKATNVQFERIQMLRDDNNRWALYLKPVEGEAFSIYPDKEDLNRFFSAVKQNERQSAQGVRMELAQKYYALGTDRPELRQDLFGTIAYQACEYLPGQRRQVPLCAANRGNGEN